MSRDLCAALALALAFVACRSDDVGVGVEAGASAVSAAPAIPSGGKLAALARSEADDALVAASVLRAGLTMVGEPELRKAYLALRRAIAKGAPMFRLRARMGSEAMLGPVRPGDEGGGALLTVDGAFARHDPLSARKEIENVERALKLIASEVSTNAASVDKSALAISDAAYDLGVRILDANADVPADTDATLADVRGALDGIDEGAVALAAELGADATLPLITVHGETKAIGAAIAAADPIAGLKDVASLVVATGRLGAAIRAIAASGGAHVRLPYPARVPIAKDGIEEPISALTLPGKRRGADRNRTAVGERALAEVGRKLFSDPILSRGGVRSCASCHDPKRWFIDGQIAPRSLDPKTPLARNTPTLLYAPIEAAAFWDGRVISPEGQALHVIQSRAEMGLDAEELAAAVSAVDEYRTAIAGSASERVSAEQVAAALVAYESAALVPADAPIDRFARGEDAALTNDERAGLDVFVGVGRCARCHVPPLFGGSRPRDFAVPVYAAIGVPTDPLGHTLDPDRGRGAITNRERDEHAFKTPTLRDISKTAPYFHNGRFARLEDVVSFYDKGGGAGLGLAVPNQDPDVRLLKLTAEATRVLLIFMREALLDRSPPDGRARP